MATKKQNEFAQVYLSEHPDVKEMYINPKGEFFTDESYANNSLEKDKDGNVIGKIQVISREPVKSEKEPEKEPKEKPEKGSKNPKSK